VIVAPTRSPPFDRPLIAIRSDRVQPEPASQRRQAAKSSKTFCLSPSGDVATLLHGYGGFQIAQSPGFVLATAGIVPGLAILPSG